MSVAARIETDKGVIRVVLHADRTPVSQSDSPKLREADLAREYYHARVRYV